MSNTARRLPKRLLDCKEAGQQANTNIRAIIRELAVKKEQNVGVIYAQLHLVVAEVDANDEAWEHLEFEMVEEIKAENAQ